VANIAQILAELDSGGFLCRANDTLAEALAAVKRTHKKAAVAVKVEIEPAGYDADGAVNQVSVTAAVAGKLPDVAAPAATYFFGDEGQLQKRDPRQPSLPIVGDSEAEPPQPAQRRAV
jgi:hypothetical protein